MKTRTTRTALMLVACAVLLVPSMIAQTGLANAGSPLVSVDRWKQALAGYDPVAYFDYGEPTHGVREYHASYGGVYYSFASVVTHKKFQADPDSYLPQFGGYCALSLALAPDELPGKQPGLYPSDPTRFKIVDGKLYLFSGEFEFDPVERWTQHQDEYLARAEANWKTIVSQR